MKKYLSLIVFGALAFAACTDNGEDGPKKDDAVAVKAAPGKIVFNELCGVKDPGKFVEIYNLTDETIDLEGCVMHKGDDAAAGEFIIWVGQKGSKIEPKGFFVLDADGATDPADVSGRTPESADVYKTNFLTGFSPKKSVMFRLLDAKGAVIDEFARGSVDEEGKWGVALPETKNASYSRVPDGTGAFVEAAPTKGAKNGEKTGDIVNSNPV